MAEIEDVQLNFLLKNAKKRAYLISGKSPLTDLEDIIDRLKLWFSNYYKIPLKSEILQTYTIDELYYEYYAVECLNTGESEKANNLILENKDELSSLFDEEFKDEFNSFSSIKKGDIGSALTKEEEEVANKMFTNPIDWIGPKG